MSPLVLSQGRGHTTECSTRCPQLSIPQAKHLNQYRALATGGAPRLRHLIALVDKCSRNSMPQSTKRSRTNTITVHPGLMMSS